MKIINYLHILNSVCGIALLLVKKTTKDVYWDYTLYSVVASILFLFILFFCTYLQCNDYTIKYINSLQTYFWTVIFWILYCLFVFEIIPTTSHEMFVYICCHLSLQTLLCIFFCCNCFIEYRQIDQINQIDQMNQQNMEYV